MAVNRTCEVVHNEESPGQIVSVALLVVAVILFVFLILKDVVKALKRKAHWIPGDFLVLGAFTVQLLSLLNSQDEDVDPSGKRRVCLNEFWMIHTSRIMLCVVVAYLIPGMANPGAENFWGKLMALALTTFLHVISELYILYPYSSEAPTNFFERLWPRQVDTSTALYIVFLSLVFACFVMLLLLLACANIAGKGIGRIVAQKVPLILKDQVEEKDHHHHQEEDHHDHFYCPDCWRSVEDAVLRAWIVARAYSLEYAVARSALASAAAVVITIQIVITIVGGVRNSPDLALHSKLEALRFTTTMLQCLFILIGWAMIEWRWLTAVAYYARFQPDKWSSCFRIEDFWTRHLKELQQKQETPLPQAQFLQSKVKKLVAEKPTKITVPGMLLYGVIAIQSFTVSFSKACRLASIVLFYNCLTGRFVSLILSKHRRKAFQDYPKYKKVLEGVPMLGETTKGLWIANHKSIAMAAHLILLGSQDGERNCEHLVEFVANKRTGSDLGLSCLEPYKPQTGLNYLCKRSSTEEDHFTDMSTKSWKMTAVSLLSIIAKLFPIYEEGQTSTSHIFLRDCVNAYAQAWEIIDFIEEANTEADEVTRDAADKYFEVLQRGVDDGRFPASKFSGATPGSVRGALEELKEESKRRMEQPGSVSCVSALGLKGKEEKEGGANGWNGSDSIDWEEAALGSAVYKLCNSIECNDGSDANELLRELESSLADIINKCLEKVQHLLLLKSRKWAVKSDEKRMGKALYTAGKARVIMEKLENRVRRS
ncbi:hypothetical protein SUGI_0849960 [Cryptomeria japonica]|nr:hypothetical protein SUGI_0849960 [Cryptomeria japonica]